MSSIHEWVVETLPEYFFLETAGVGPAESYRLMLAMEVSLALSRAVKQLQRQRKLPQISWDRTAGTPAVLYGRWPRQIGGERRRLLFRRKQVANQCQCRTDCHQIKDIGRPSSYTNLLIYNEIPYRGARIIKAKARSGRRGRRFEPSYPDQN